MRFFIAGMIGGLIGAIAWAAVTHATQMELGLVAWLVGVLAGITVRAVSNDDLGSTSGAAALVAAIVCIVIGKLGVSYLTVRNLNAMSVGADEATSTIARLVARERERAGQPVQWPAGVHPLDAWDARDYPPDIWAEAEARWNAYPATQQDYFLRYPLLLDSECVQQLLADEIVEEFEQKGQTIRVAEHVRNGETASGPDRYPAEVWAETTRRWEALSAPERKEYERQYTSVMDIGQSIVMPFIVIAGAIASISLWDLLWFALAGVSAWKIGSGSSGIVDS